MLSTFYVIGFTLLIGSPVFGVIAGATIYYRSQKNAKNEDMDLSDFCFAGVSIFLCLGLLTLLISYLYEEFGSIVPITAASIVAIVITALVIYLILKINRIKNF